MLLSATLCAGAPSHPAQHAQGWVDQLQAFAVQHFLSDAELTAEMEASRGAAHYDMDQHWVSGL